MGTYGIDLGTTYSCIAKLNQDGNPEVIQNYIDGTYTLASAVFFEEDSNNTLYGDSAKDYMETSPERLVQFAKREIGKPNGKVWNIDGKQYTPIEISSLILKKLKQIAEEQGETVEDVVITVPAYFGLEEKAATKTAGELAGLNVVSLINEPTAAALSYSYREFQDNQVIVIYDLGGGTFDVTVLNMAVVRDENGENKRQVTVLASAGDDRLGGKDWDDILYSILLERYCEEIGMDVSELDPDTRQSVRSKVETTKKNLTIKDRVKVKIKSDAGPINFEITRDEFEEATSHLVARTLTFLDSALAEAGNVSIDKLLLVGGSTNMLMIKNAIEDKFPGIVQVEDPEKAVAKGAAIYASILLEEIENKPTIDKPVPPKPPTPIDVVDKTSRSFGPGVLIRNEYLVDNLIKRGDKLPATVTKNYYPIEDNQSAIVFKVFESMTTEDRVVPCEDIYGDPQDTNPEYMMKCLGQLTLELPPGTPQSTKIATTFAIDSSGLDVTAKNLTTNESNTVRLEFETSMTESQKNESKRKLNMLSLED